MGTGKPKAGMPTGSSALSGAVVAATLWASALSAQARPLGPNVARYVSVNAPVVALTHVRVVDGTGAPAREDQTIVIRGDRIDAVGSASTTQDPDRRAGAGPHRLTPSFPASSACTSTRGSAACAREHADERERTTAVPRAWA